MGQRVMKISFCLLGVFISAAGFSVLAEEENIPRGMEIIKIGETKVFIPQGAKITKHGDVLVLENTAEYASRRILDMQKELEQLKASIDRLRIQVEELKIKLDEKKQTPVEEKQRANP